MPNENKPLLLRPSGKDYLWGGSRLNDDFEKNIDLTPLAETWECSTHPDGPSYVVGGAFDGQELAAVLKTHPEYLGERHKGENTLPILIKFIDAKKDLSVQVHPTDAYAQEHEGGQLGKTEMWYVLDAGRDAKLVYGIFQPTAGWFRLRLRYRQEETHKIPSQLQNNDSRTDCTVPESCSRCRHCLSTAQVMS